MDRGTVDQGGDTEVVTDRRYGSVAPVVLRVRRRSRRTVIDDLGSSVRLAGRPPGWLDRAERIARDAGVNVNRRGVLYVPTVDDRDLDRLLALVAAASLEVYDTLLDA